MRLKINSKTANHSIPLCGNYTNVMLRNKLWVQDNAPVALFFPNSPSRPLMELDVVHNPSFKTKMKVVLVSD